MRHAFRVTCGVATLVLAGCSVQVQNQTPDHFQANPDIGMYPISATVSSGALVSTPIYLFDVGSGKKIQLKPDASGSRFRTMIPVSCTSSFPLQFLAVWRLQGVATRQKLFPAQPQTVQLIAPPLTDAVTIDTSGKPTKGLWQGNVPYKFVTAGDTNITGAKIEPLSQSRADVQSAKMIHIVSSFPLDAPCNTKTPVVLASRVRSAQANLVIQTNMPGMSQWTTKVTFAPTPTGE